MPTTRNRLALPVLTLTAAAAALIACGGGGGSDPASAPPLVNFGSTAPLPSVLPAGTTVMNCVDGASFQCSGATVLRSENDVSVTSSGVQAYGRSTSDRLPGNQNTTTATGFEPTSGGVAEVRFSRQPNGTVTRAGLILTNVGISWDAIRERPPTVEVFEPTQGISKLDGTGALSWDNALPAHTDLNYYDFAGLTINAHQANYANNRYFPRTGNPARGGPDVETTGIAYVTGDFRSVGTDPDRTSAHRLHSDGDVNAGDRTGFPNLGVPFAGNKGYRDLLAYSFDYANLATWVTEETAEVDEWTNSNNEHTTNRRGVVAFGATTDPTAVPSAGGIDYKGVVYGWYTTNGVDMVFYRAAATVSVNFDSRQVAVKVSNAVDANAPATTVPLTVLTTAGMGRSGDNVANYFTGAIASTDLNGGVGGRFFGPVAAGRSGNVGPAEIAGSFSLKNATTKAATVGGFIGRRQ